MIELTEARQWTKEIAEMYSIDVEKAIELTQRVYRQGIQDGAPYGRVIGRDEMRAEFRKLLGISPTGVEPT